MLLSKDYCYRCKAERAVRECPRLKVKKIGWDCCNSLRVDFNCPAECPFAPLRDERGDSPFPAFRADSNTEFVNAAKRYIDLWSQLPNPDLDGLSPANRAAADPDAVLRWLQRFQYPANFPVNHLMQRLGIKHEPTPEPQTPETVASAFLECVIALDWDALRPLTHNDLDDPDLAQRYRSLISAVPELKKVKSFQILHAGAADDGVSALVMFNLNRKTDWTMILGNIDGNWRVRQNFNGSPSLYYAQNQLFRSIADALGSGKAELASELISRNRVFYPDCADLHYYLGLYWQLRQDQEKSRAELLNALAVDNGFFEAGYALSTLYLGLNDLGEAQRWLRRLQALKPDDLNVQNNLAACEAGLGNIDAAVALWNRILATAPNYQLARKNLERYQP